jgi:preprotein translocase subunit SecY
VTLPKATASGPAASTPDAVRPARVAIGAGVLAALYLLVLYLATPVPTRVLALFGGAKNDVERYGGLEMVWSPPPGMSDAEVVARFRTGDDRAQVRRDKDAFVISVPRIRADEVDSVAKLLGGAQGLEFHRVLRVDEMARLARLVDLPIRGAKPVDLEIDQWRPDDGGQTRTDYYLLGTSKAIEAKLAEAEAKGWRLPEGTRLAWEYIEDPTTPDLWRTYVIDERAELDGGDVANAMGSYDPNTNRPIVLLDFTDDGAQKLGTLTAEIVGEKLATMIGDQVYSAPIINDAIRGGRASIAMGGSDAVRQERERDLLVTTLRVGALPKGGTIVTSRYVAPVAKPAMQRLARAAIALAGGALIALLVWIVVRVTRPVRRPAVLRIPGTLPASRVFVTLLAPVALYAVTRIFALGINEEELEHIVTKGSDGWSRGAIQSFSFGALGIMPVISAFIFVEVIALFVPSWRRRRHAGPDARAPISAAAVMTAITLIVLQSWFVTQYLYSLSRAGAEVLEPGLVPRMLLMGSFAAGTLALAGVAALIRTHGLGNGYGVLLVSGFLLGVWDRWLDLEGLLDQDFIVGGMTCLAIAIPLITVARWRIARVGEVPLRVPTSGVAPLGEVGGLVSVVVLITTFSSGDIVWRFNDWVIAARQHHVVLVALVAVLTLLWSFAFARPNVTRRLAERVGLVAPANATFWSATALSAAVLVLVGAAAMMTNVVFPSAAWLADAITIAIVTMVGLDIYDDMRARRVTLDRVWSLHQAQHVDLVGRALDDAGIPHHFTSSNLKTLLAFFGPFAAVDVLVPPEHAPAARQRLRELFE